MNNTSGSYRPSGSCLSPYDENNDRTLTINSLNSSAIDERRHKHEDRKHSNSPESSHRKSRQDYRRQSRPKKYQNDASMDYYDNSMDQESPDFQDRSKLAITNDEMSEIDVRQNTSELVMSQVQRDFEEGDEYENEESEEEDPSDLGYHQNTLESSHYPNNSLDEQTTSQFINGKEISNDVLFRQNHGEITNDRQNNMYYSDDYEDEESENDEEQSITHESQISGIESLSRTDNSRWSKKNMKRSDRYNRSGRERVTADFYKDRDTNSQFNESGSNYRREASDSIGVKTRKDINQESYYETESQSMESWGTKTPKQALVGVRRTQVVKQPNHINFREQSRSPDEDRSLRIDSNPRINRKRGYKKEDTEQDYSRSNLLESSQDENIHTEVRQKRSKPRRKKTKTSKRSTIQTPMSRGTIQTPMSRATENIPRDTDLEEALSHSLEENKQVVDKLKEYDSNPYIFTTESEHTNESVHEFEKISFKRLKIENRRLKADLHKAR